MLSVSPLFYAVPNRMRFGEYRGGMFVRARGVVDGKAMQMSWHLLAEGDDGPYIPSMAIEAIVRRLLDGKRPEVGSRSGGGRSNLMAVMRCSAAGRFSVAFGAKSPRRRSIGSFSDPRSAICRSACRSSTAVGKRGCGRAWRRSAAGEGRWRA